MAGAGVLLSCATAPKRPAPAPLPPLSQLREDLNSADATVRARAALYLSRVRVVPEETIAQLDAMSTGDGERVVKEWTFEPARCKERPIASVASAPVTFRITP